jgi:FkbM family methyltransferase
VYKDSNERTQDYLANFKENDVLKKLVGKTAPVIVDVGANIGQTADKLKRIWHNSWIHCIEPLHEQYKYLKRNTLHLNGVKTYNIALGSWDGPRKFYINEHQPMLSGFYELNPDSEDSIALNQPEDAHDNFLNAQETIVDCMTLDNWAITNEVTHIDLLKMDAQGAEPDILRGGREILKNTHVIVTELMFYDLYKKKNSFYEIESTLIPLGFELFDIGYVSKNPMTGRTDWVDVIYVKRDEQ